MKKIILPAMMAAAIFAGCSKSDDNNDTSAADFETTKNAGIADFVNVVAMPGYAELKVKATTLNNSVVALNASATEPNLAAAKAAWRDMRSTWEKCEGYLFGPVEDDNYDPDTDTWPVDYTELDGTIANPANTFDAANMEALPTSVKGYHPLEYILWGTTGNRTAASITARQKLYMVGLSAHLLNKANALHDSWLTSGGNYSTTFLNAGKAGNTLFPKKQSAYTALATGISDICGEVGEGKMKEPYDAMNPLIVESPFSGNSVTDFKNNIIGAYNVYLCKFNADGAGLENLVHAKNAALDIELQSKFNAAIASFNNITIPYEQAIISQRTQCAAAMAAINALADAVDNKLKPFIVQYVTD
jgi:putative iron-regulated protein